MRKYLLLIFFALFPFSAIHAEIEWKLSDDGTLTISGTGDMPDYGDVGPYKARTFKIAPWFSQKNKIKKVVIEDGVTSIGNEAFYECDSITSITIPNSVTSIGVAAFDDCSSLTSITIPNSVTSIGKDAFYYCKGLASITIPNSVKSIENSTFQYCIGLASITIPNSVTSIGEHAFYGCMGLTSITIPKSVTSIDECAFWLCSNLTSITFEGSTPPKFGYDVFEDIIKSIPVYVPANSLEAYKKALGYYFEETSIQALQR